MKIIEPGHIYELDWLDGEPESLMVPHAIYGVMKDGVMKENRLIFVNREDSPHGGSQTQEVLRVLIDRTIHCDNCLRWPGNDDIIHHLRMALVLHEARALRRKTEKGLILPEHVVTGADGHFGLEQSLEASDDAVTYGCKNKD